MMLPKVIYETQPYVYMSAGVAEISYFKTMITTSLGLLFFLAGALVWILRSNHRRQDPKVTRKESGLNRNLYEIKPFLYILFGVLFSTWGSYWALYPLASLSILIGVYLLLNRIKNRTRRRLYMSSER